MLLEHSLADKHADKSAGHGCNDHDEQNPDRRDGSERVNELLAHAAAQRVGEEIVPHDPDRQKAADEVQVEEQIAYHIAPLNQAKSSLKQRLLKAVATDHRRRR